MHSSNNVFREVKVNSNILYYCGHNILNIMAESYYSTTQITEFKY